VNSRTQPKLDNRKARSDATRHALMRAAEKLIAANGLENVTIRDILAEADQKNASALQYHFKNRNGLIEAIHRERSQQTQAKRGELLDELLTRTPEPSLGEICRLMVQPVFELARSRIDFRRYVKAFGHELALSETSALSQVSRQGGGGTSGQRVGTFLRQALPHLDEAAYRRRLESAVRLCSAAMYHQARQRNAFRGKQAELFVSSLIDALAGLLNAPESDETRTLAAALEDRRQRP
jgi:AcrR family transcriptional regulator